MTKKKTKVWCQISESVTISFLGRYSTQHVIDFYKAKLKSMPCQNQGFVLDGFPKTEEEAKELFARKF